MKLNPLTPEEILELYDLQERREAVFPDMRRDVLPGLVRFVRDLPGMSFILHSSLEAEKVEASIQEQVAFFQAHGGPFEWKVYDFDKPPNLAEKLATAGFQPDDEDAILALELAYAPAELLAPVRADIRPITTRQGLEDIIAVLEGVYGGSYAWITYRLGGHLEIPGYLSAYAAYAGEQPAACGWIYFPANSQFAGLWGGATLEAQRGRGLYTALLATRLQEARQRGYRFLMVDASPMSRPILEKHGFQLIATAVGWQWKPGN